MNNCIVPNRDDDKSEHAIESIETRKISTSDINNTCFNHSDNGDKEHSELEELWFLRHCLNNAQQVHVLVCNSLCQHEERERNEQELLELSPPSSFLTSSYTQESKSLLLREDVQTYLRFLLHKYRDGKLAERRKVPSANCLYFLECLTNEALRDEFLAVASSAVFASI